MAKKTHTITVELTDGTSHVGKGSTCLEALMALTLDYAQIKTKGTVTLKIGQKVVSRLFYLPQLRRLFLTKLRKIQLAKDFEYLLR